jgi:nucleoside-diphosphate-sugar epimerase
MAIDISGKNLKIKNLHGKEFIEKYGFKCPSGVNGRNSDNTLFREKVGWESKKPLYEGLKKTYDWIDNKVKEQKSKTL